MTYVYTSPLRPLDLGYLPRVNRESLDLDHMTPGEWTPAFRYAFTFPLPERFVFQWSLELVGQPEQEQEYDECGCKPGEPCASCDWSEDESDHNPWERDNDEAELL